MNWINHTNMFKTASRHLFCYTLSYVLYITFKLGWAQNSITFCQISCSIQYWLLSMLLLLLWNNKLWVMLSQFNNFYFGLVWPNVKSMAFVGSVSFELYYQYSRVPNNSTEGIIVLGRQFCLPVLILVFNNSTGSSIFLLGTIFVT